MPPAIEIRGVSKSFRLYREKYTSLKERVIHFGQPPHEEFWALRGIDMEIPQGQTVGLLGHNGSGKSTLLKCVAGILRPDSGEIRTTGRVAALLELGAGFHPDLSGRENVFMNASILGMRRSEIEKKFDDIVGFAELEQFIDNQVKHYSSGMYVRLGFAIAINVEPDVLLVDEVLAVGDEAFQRKCIDRVKAFQREGRTIVVVTHATDLVRQLCDRAAALDHGHMIADGLPGPVIREFRERLMGSSAPGEQPADPSESPLWRRVKITAADVHYPDESRDHLLPGEPLRLVVSYESEEHVDDVICAIAIHHPDGHLLYSTNTEVEGVDLSTLDGGARVTFAFDYVALLDGAYTVSVGLHTLGGLLYDQREDLCRFQVLNPGREVGMLHFPLTVEAAAVHPETVPNATNEETG